MAKINSKRTSKLNNSLSVEKKFNFNKISKSKLFYQSLHVFKEIISSSPIHFSTEKDGNFSDSFHSEHIHKNLIKITWGKITNQCYF